MSGNYLYSFRKKLGFAEEWLCIIKRDWDGRISCDAVDPVHHLWHPLPPVPEDFAKVNDFGCAVLRGCHLYFFGGKDLEERSIKRVIFYSARTNKWHRAPDMLRRRHFFVSSVINNCLYIAGGESDGSHCPLRSAEVYDPNKKHWSSISDMSTSLLPILGVVHSKKWIITGIAPQRILYQVYSPETDTWHCAFDGMVEGLRNPCTSLNGKMYVADCKERYMLKVYDEATGMI